MATHEGSDGTVAAARAGTAARQRTYGDGCAAARALDVIGERWALLIVRELIFGPRRFTDLAAGLSRASPNVLSQRLRELEAAGVVRRRRLAPPARAWVYDLTEWGRRLEPILVELGRWGTHSPFHDPSAPVGVESLMLAVRAHFDPARFTGDPVTLQVDIDEDEFVLAVSADGGLTISRDRVERPDAEVRADLATFRALIIERAPLQAARDADRLGVTGDEDALVRFLAAIASPPAM